MANSQETKGSCGRRGFELEVSLEWGATRICTRAYFLVYINDLEEGVTGSILKFADELNCSEKLMKLENQSSGLKNDRCYSILGNVYTQGLETLA